MLTYHRTSLLESQVQTVVNTVNTVGVMGKGLAAEMKSRHPEMFDKYQQLCAEGLIEVGKLWLWKGASQWVLNFPTKKHWRHPSRIEYIELGLKKFVSQYEAKGIREIAFPRLGCGNGGLDWEQVQPIMHRYLVGLPIRVDIHDFDASIKVPEHREYAPPHAENSFHDFLCDIRASIELNDGIFHRLSGRGTFKARMINDGGETSILILDESGQHAIDEFELYDLWVALSKGPATIGHTTNERPRIGAELLSLLSSLSYLRLIEVSRDGSKGTKAIELRRSNFETGLLLA
jgi:O-acetyl-ADP-ribose deacetylase (regulator of RNase III)